MVFPFLPFMSVFRNTKHHYTSQQQISCLMKNSLLEGDEGRKKLFNLSMRYHEKWDKILANSIELSMPGVPRKNAFSEMQDDYAELSLFEMMQAKRLLDLEKETYVYDSPAKRAQDLLREEVAKKCSKYESDNILPFQKIEKRMRESWNRPKPYLKYTGPLTREQKTAIMERILARYGKPGNKEKTNKKRKAKVVGTTDIVFKLVVVEPEPAVVEPEPAVVEPKLAVVEPVPAVVEPEPAKQQP